MAFEVRPATVDACPFIAETFWKRSTHLFMDPNVKVTPEEFKDAMSRRYADSINYANETKKEAIIVAVEKSTGKYAAWAHWVFPQDTDDPSPWSSPVIPPGLDRDALVQMGTQYRSSKMAIIQQRPKEKQPCYLLHNLFASEDFSNQGAGGLLIRWPFEEADKKGIPIILGTSREGLTVPMYEKHGFKVSGPGYDVTRDKEVISFVQMLREPNITGKMQAAILVVSDTASKDASTDKSGAALQETFEKEGGDQWEVNTVQIVPDDLKLLEKKITTWTGARAGADATSFNLIVTTGGTGFAVKDNTPEAVEPLLDRKAPGLVHLMLGSSLQVTPYAAMARPVAGTRGKTIIVTLPGSPKGARENLQSILKLLPHACQQAAGADSRSLHVGGVKKLEADAGISAAKRSSSVTPTAGQSGHHHHHHHQHHHGDGHGQGPAGPHTLPEDRPVPNNPSLGASARYRESPYPKLPVSEALERIYAVTPTPEIEERAVNQDLVGSILAEDVAAPHPVPAFRASIVDGYACVISSDSHNEKGAFPVVSISHAAPGSIATLQAGTLARITTGAPLPPNASAVVMVEDTVLHKMSDDGKDEAEVQILTDQVRSGENVREVGSDIAAGSIVLQKGTKVSAVGGELGVLASVGRAKVKVYRKPIIGVMSTGDEIVPHDREGELRLGEVRDTNRITLMSAISGWGYEVVDLGITKDTPGALETALRSAIRKARIIVTTGGVSMGELDLLKPTIERTLGGTIHFGRVAMKPGMPTTFATVPHKGIDGNPATALIFSLPGNPASGMVTAGLFMRPCLDKISGVSDKTLGMPRVKIVLESSTRADAKREEYQRSIVWQGDDGRLYGQTTGMQRSSRIGSFALANCLLVIPAGAGLLEKGQVVDGLLLSGLGHAQ